MSFTIKNHRGPNHHWTPCLDLEAVKLNIEDKTFISPKKLTANVAYLVISTYKKNKKLERYNSIENDYLQNALYDLKDGKTPSRRLPKALKGGPPDIPANEFNTVPFFKGGEIIEWVDCDNGYPCKHITYKIDTLIECTSLKNKFGLRPREKQTYKITKVTDQT